MVQTLNDDVLFALVLLFGLPYLLVVHILDHQIIPQSVLDDSWLHLLSLLLLRFLRRLLFPCEGELLLGHGDVFLFAYELVHAFQGLLIVLQQIRRQRVRIRCYVLSQLLVLLEQILEMLLNLFTVIPISQFCLDLFDLLCELPIYQVVVLIRVSFLVDFFQLRCFLLLTMVFLAFKLLFQFLTLFLMVVGQGGRSDLEKDLGRII